MDETSLYAALPKRLVPWYAQNKRDLPWRKSREPYRVWVSEIMLQQTRVEAVIGYYARFLTALPDVFALSTVPETDLLKLWEGLGYYSRARNLQKAAKVLARAYGGVFPRTAEELRKLPGIGEYTAGAIASICFDQPVAAVDGNVLRVVSRVTGSEAPIDDPAVKKEMTAALTAVYPTENCGDFTQSFMDLGSGICTPRTPDCARCPLADLCRAHAQGDEGRLPIKNPKKERRTEEKTVFLLTCGEKIALCRRKASGLLANLWQLPNVDGALDAKAAFAAAEALGAHPSLPRRELHREHIFTHIRWDMVCYELECRDLSGDFVWADRAEIDARYALPTAFRKFLEE